MKIQNFGAYLLCLVCMQQPLLALLNTRSQSLDLPRFMVGWTNQTYLCQDKNRYGVLSLIPQYNHSLFNRSIAESLFGTDSINTATNDQASIGISGSQVGSRNAKDWLADYFGLPTDYQSVVSLKPKISSFIFDINFYFSFDSLCSNLFLWLQIPIVHSRSALECSERIINAGTNSYPPGYFGPNEVPRSSLLPDFNRFIGYEQVPTIDTANGIVFEPLVKNRFALPVNQTLNTTQLSDLYVVAGWSPLLNEDGHLGFGGICVAPTGSHVKDDFIFQPIVGNGHHWEAGAYLTSRYAFWHGCDDYHSLIVSCDAIITHMFSAKQYRTLDIKNGQSSKYMLAQKISGPANQFLFGSGTNVSGGPTIAAAQPSAQFQNVYTPLANLTSTQLKVSHDVQADITAMLTYTTQHESIAIDLGYDFWIRTKDKITPCYGTALSSGQWALKGDAYTYGFGASNATIGANATIPLSATESTATIHAGTNNQKTQNPGIDNPQFGVTSAVVANITDYINSAPSTPATALNQQRISMQPIALSDNDLDWEKEKKEALSHKVFLHGSYTWPDSCGFWSPYLGFGCFAEFAYEGKKHDEKNHALSQCGVWMKTGLSF